MDSTSEIFKIYYLAKTKGSWVILGENKNHMKVTIKDLFKLHILLC